MYVCACSYKLSIQFLPADPMSVSMFFPQTQVVWNNTSGTPILPGVRMNRLALDPDVEDSQFRLSDGVFATARRSCNSEEGPLIPWEE